MSEQWRPVPRYEGLYDVSDQGRVRSWWRRTTSPRYLRPAPNQGHLTVKLCDGRGDRDTRFVHSLVLEAFVGPRPAGLITRHLDGNPANNRLENLRYGTTSENEKDKVRHGTHNWASRTHCPRGHAYDEANTYYNRGHRTCRRCKMEKKRAQAA